MNRTLMVFAAGVVTLFVCNLVEGLQLEQVCKVGETTELLEVPSMRQNEQSDNAWNRKHAADLNLPYGGKQLLKAGANPTTDLYERTV